MPALWVPKTPSTACDLGFSDAAEDRGTRYARMVDRAATALPGADERVHLHTTAADERHGQETSKFLCCATNSPSCSVRSTNPVSPADRTFLAALLHRLPKPTLRQLHLIVSPDTILRWHRDLLRRHHAHASRSKRPGRPPTVRSASCDAQAQRQRVRFWATQDAARADNPIGAGVSIGGVRDRGEAWCSEPRRSRNRSTTPGHGDYAVSDRDRILTSTRLRY
jgi:hypothetical protein